jgi:dolichyl-phosphate beta-glucosyltransferase
VSDPPAVRPRVDLEVVVPAANEARRLGPTLRRLTETLAALPLTSAVVVVDNASTDATADVARSVAHPTVAVHVVPCPVRGKGFAVRAGVLSGRARWVGFMDADLATRLDALPVALDQLGLGRRVVIGSRALPESVVTARHRAARRFGAFVFRRTVATVVPEVRDTQCGFKFFDGDLARAVFGDLVEGGFAFDVEVLASCQQRGATIVEVPVRWDDQPGSTFRPGHDGWRSFVEVWRISRRVAGRDVVATPDTLVLPHRGEAELATGA